MNNRPIPLEELQALIAEACERVPSAIALTQELVAHCALIMRTEPHIFSGVFRIRIGLILLVLQDEISRSLQCNSGIPLESIKPHIFY